MSPEKKEKKASEIRRWVYGLRHTRYRRQGGTTTTSNADAANIGRATASESEVTLIRHPSHARSTGRISSLHPENKELTHSETLERKASVLPLILIFPPHHTDAVTPETPQPVAPRRVDRGRHATVKRTQYPFSAQHILYARTPSCSPLGDRLLRVRLTWRREVFFPSPQLLFPSTHLTR